MDVIIVDDELAGRRTLRELCEAERDLRVVGEYGDGATALDAIRAMQPQLLFLDIHMDPLNGIDLARALNLSDHFAFRSPADPSQLSMIMYFNPRSLPGKQYTLSTKARYELHVSKVATRTTAPTWPVS